VVLGYQIGNGCLVPCLSENTYLLEGEGGLTQLYEKKMTYGREEIFVPVTQRNDWPFVVMFVAIFIFVGWMVR
jgi:hypothetical protein